MYIVDMMLNTHILEITSRTFNLSISIQEHKPGISFTILNACTVFPLSFVSLIIYGSQCQPMTDVSFNVFH